MSDETYYALLGVPENATHPEIKAAFRNLLKQIHPDTVSNLSPDVRELAGEATQQILQAYSVLSNEALRRQYDRQLAERRSSTIRHAPAHLRRRRHRSKTIHGSFRTWAIQHPFLVLGYILLFLMLLTFLWSFAMAMFDYYSGTDDESGSAPQMRARFFEPTA